MESLFLYDDVTLREFYDLSTVRDRHLNTYLAKMNMICLKMV